MSEHVLQVTDSNFSAEVTATTGTVLVDFNAVWCGPCRTQAPILDRFAVKHPDVKVVAVDVDDAPATAAHYGIRSVPTLAVFIDGKPAIGAAGVRNESGLLALIEQARSKAA